MADVVITGFGQAGQMSNAARDFCAVRTGASVPAQVDVASIQKRWLEGQTGANVIPDSVAKNGAASAGRTQDVRNMIDCIGDVASANGYQGVAVDALKAHAAYDSAWMKQKLLGIGR